MGDVGSNVLYQVEIVQFVWGRQGSDWPSDMRHGQTMRRAQRKMTAPGLLHFGLNLVMASGIRAAGGWPVEKPRIWGTDRQTTGMPVANQHAVKTTHLILVSGRQSIIITGGATTAPTAAPRQLHPSPRQCSRSQRSSRPTRRLLFRQAGLSTEPRLGTRTITMPKPKSPPTSGLSRQQPLQPRRPLTRHRAFGNTKPYPR